MIALVSMLTMASSIKNGHLHLANGRETIPRDSGLFPRLLCRDLFLFFTHLHHRNNQAKQFNYASLRAKGRTRSFLLRDIDPFIIRLSGAAWRKSDGCNFHKQKNQLFSVTEIAIKTWIIFLIRLYNNQHGRKLKMILKNY